MRRPAYGCTVAVVLLALGMLTGCVSSGRGSGRGAAGTGRDGLGLRTGRYRRHAVVHVPVGYRPTRAVPLVLVLHGAFSTAKEMERRAAWIPVAEREGFILAYPQGIGLFGKLQHWNAGHCCGKAADDEWDDMGFLTALIDGLCRSYAIDESRIYMVGFSNGGMMTYRFAAERPTRLAAAAVVAGAIGSRTSPETPAWRLPEPVQPVPMLIMHGLDDPSIPAGGGIRSNRASNRQYESVWAAAAFWRRANGMTGEPTIREWPDGGMREESWMVADGQCLVRLSLFKGVGHEWPGRRLMRGLEAGHPLKEFDGAEYVWDFLKRHVRLLVAQGEMPEA